MPIVIPDPLNTPGGALKRLPLLKAAVAFIAAVCLCLCGLLYLQLEQSRHHDLDAARIASANLTRAMAQQAQDTFLQADLVLASLTDWIQVDGFGPALQPRLHRTFARRVQSLEQLHGLFLFDKSGHWVVTSFDDLQKGDGVADREYFAFHQQNASLIAHIGPAIRSRQNGDWIIPVSRRVNDQDGNFQGVLLAGIKMSYFDSFFRSFSLDDQGEMALALTDGTLLARRPFDETQIGRVMAQESLFRHGPGIQKPDTAMIRSADGVVRLYDHQHLLAYPLMVTVAMSEQAILAGWYGKAFQSSLIVALVVTGICLFGWVFVRQVRNSERIEADLRKAQETLRLIATHDSLTGLANRRLFERALDIEFGRGARQRSPLSLILLDIDYFKRYNDAYGHVAGDHCLAQVAKVLKGCCHRKADLAVRYGGEEFAVLLPDTDLQGAMTLAEQIRQSLIDKHITHSGSPTGYLTVSLGCHAFVPSSLDSIEVFIQRADAALYQAKHSGRNRVQAWSTESGFDTLERSDR
ncbi:MULTISPECIES: GGDEF domain-containing protein [unclassified Pseudomonas]|uniref:sensor domain-containing diguanylate cyclase n=1 Tax=unclassified Pseudomonas TaxID=196821 RepID=UPI001199C3A5|nr:MULTISPECIES: GGDEF domain-containing protein [unclassified Pseudomonas]TWC15670.1 diguanylate cyclase (GGDEF)-like protein [Pseudomonas sp. SJZ074]TWC21169.1 diguanylate cyclase (GGDEF)-like protein [Pseudomonas sp. SJZ075]TWC33946.1 diguanylate cyclase (GGDEF)-like protein [Pseudomonas sp. SJZ085]TWC36649.1 diguanylate cyclase (GGDEF)-like protein [Pseudomonas sp. SJZ078]TWC57408.1 diguanylate cyclase (GGDEF)-like protein [Pseudomonas sp. SJZ124]